MKNQKIPFKVKITIIAEVESQEYDTIQSILDELSSETDYTLSDTTNVKVLDTELREIEII